MLIHALSEAMPSISQPHGLIGVTVAEWRARTAVAASAVGGDGKGLVLPERAYVKALASTVLSAGG